MVKQGILSGQSITVNNQEIHQVRCPECKGPQWEYRGKTECIYCETPFLVMGLQIVPVALPDKKEGNGRSNGLPREDTDDSVS